MERGIVKWQKCSGHRGPNTNMSNYQMTVRIDNTIMGTFSQRILNPVKTTLVYRYTHMSQMMIF